MPVAIKVAIDIMSIVQCKAYGSTSPRIPKIEMKLNFMLNMFSK